MQTYWVNKSPKIYAVDSLNGRNSPTQMVQDLNKNKIVQPVGILFNASV